MADDKNKLHEDDANRDPLSGETGAHPVGTGIGAAGAGTAGTIIGGAIGGPVGAVVGAVVGSFAGGIVGKGVAESVNPTVEDEYWRTNHASQSYVEAGTTYDDYHPAYRTGYEGYSRYAGTGRTYNDIEPELQRDYETNRGKSNLGWEKAKHASRAAWDKVERALPGDADHDGK